MPSYTLLRKKKCGHRSPLCNCKIQSRLAYPVLWTQATHPLLLQKAMHGLRDVSCVHRVVIGIRTVVALLDEAEELPGLRHVQLEVGQQPVDVKQMHTQHRQAPSWGAGAIFE